MAKVPPIWINNEFLEKALRSGVDRNISVVSSEVKPACAVGDNYTSNMWRACLKIKRGGGEEETSAILKILKPFEHIDNHFQIDAFKIESTTFTDVLRPMSELLGHKHQPFAAKHIYSHFGAEANALVMEDLKNSGFRLAESQVCVDMKHCLLVMRTIARYHAASLAFHQKDSKCFDLYEKNAFCVPGIENTTGPIFTAMAKACANEVETWDDFKEKYSGKLHSLADNVLQHWVKAVDADKDGFHVLTHGDLWVNNMMFRYSEENGEVQDVRFVDFQLTHWASPAVDILYFLNTSAAIEVLEQHENVIKEYHNTLCDTLSELGHQHLQPSLDVINKEIEERKIFGVLSAILIRAVCLADRNRTPDFVKIMKGEASFHLSNAFKADIRQLLPLYEKWGWLNV